MKYVGKNGEDVGGKLTNKAGLVGAADLARQPKLLRVRKLQAGTGLYPGRPVQGKETVTVPSRLAWSLRAS